MCFASIFVPDFPVEALLRAEPELRTHPVAMMEGKAPLQKVFAVNEKARCLGIEPGMTKLQVETCPQVALRGRSALQEASAHAALLDCAQSFSPRVEDTDSDTLVLDLSGLESLFGPPAKMAREIAQRASQLGLEVNVAVASNPDTAVIAARGFSGVTVIASGKEAEQLGILRVEVLFAGMNPSTVLPEPKRLLDTLERWGVRNLRALALLPDVALSERLGQAGIRLQQLARGIGSRTLVPVEAPMVFEEAVELEHPVVLLEPLAFLLSRLLEQICSRLAARALATQEIKLELALDTSAHRLQKHSDSEQIREGHEFTRADRPFTFVIPSRAKPRLRGEHERGICSSRVFPQHVQSVIQSDEIPGRPLSPERDDEAGQFHKNIFRRTLRLPVLLLDPKIFLKLLQLDLKAHPPGAPIVKIQLAAEPVRPRAGHSGLFQPPSPEPEKLELTLARIAGIVGEDKVGSAELLDTYRRDGFRMQRFAVREVAPASCRQKPEPHAGGTPPLNSKGVVTALRIFRPPLQSTVTIRDGRPARIVCAKKKGLQGDILWTAGPWRSSGDWWDQEGWARDEWDIAVQENSGIALYRLVRDLMSGKWLVEGSYD